MGATLVASRTWLRNLLTGFCIFAAAGWVASLAFLTAADIIASRQLSSFSLIAFAVVLVAVEVGGGVFMWWRIRRAVSILTSGWTPVAVILALGIAVGNVAAGMATG